jgi:hypothetical protein
VNRPKTVKRIAPSAMNWQERPMYVATATDYTSDARPHQLNPVLRGMYGLRRESSLMCRMPPEPGVRR